LGAATAAAGGAGAAVVGGGVAVWRRVVLSMLAGAAMTASKNDFKRGVGGDRSFSARLLLFKLLSFLLLS